MSMSTNLSVSLGKEKVFDVIDRLSSNPLYRKSIQSSIIQFPDSLGDNDSSIIPYEEEMSCLLETIGNLPNLKRLKLIFNNTNSTRELPWQAMGSALQQATQLTLLNIDCVHLSFVSNDNMKNSFMESLQKHPSLKEFKLSFLRLSPSPVSSITTTTTTTLDLIVQALSNIITLERLCIYVKPYPTGFTNGLKDRSMQLLVSKCIHLRVLKLGGIELCDSHIQSLVTSLQQPNRCLQELRLWCCNITNKSAVLLSELLRVNTSLEVLDLSRNHITEVGCIALTEALKVNTTIIGLYLHQNTQQQQQQQQTVRMETDTNHDRMRNQNNNTTSSKAENSDYYYRALETMFENNFVIKDLWWTPPTAASYLLDESILTSPASPHSIILSKMKQQQDEGNEEEEEEERKLFQMIYFYLRLNAIGKRKFLLQNENISQDECINILLSVVVSSLVTDSTCNNIHDLRNPMAHANANDPEKEQNTQKLSELFYYVSNCHPVLVA